MYEYYGGGYTEILVSSGRVTGSNAGTPYPGGALSLSTHAAALGVSLTYTLTYTECTLEGQTAYGEVYNNFAVVDETGASHSVDLLVNLNEIVSGGPSFGCGANIYGNGHYFSTSGTGSASDTSGYQVVATLNSSGTSFSAVIYDRSGNACEAGPSFCLPLPSTYNAPFTNVTADPDGIQASVTESLTGATYTDSLGATVLSVFPGAGWPGSGTVPDVYKYTDVKGNSQSIQVNYTQYTQRTNFACGSGIYDFGPYTAYFPASVVLADGETYSLSYEPTPGYPNDITGRLAQITLPNKGYIAYGYSGGNNGYICGSNGVVPTLTRTINDNNGHSGTWTYSTVLQYKNGNITGSTVTETDPAGNVTTYTFVGEFQVEKVVTDKNLGTLVTTITCYNGSNSSQSNCLNMTNQTYSSGYVFQTDVYTTLGSSTTASLAETFFDNTQGMFGHGDQLYVKNYAVGTYPASGTPDSETDTTYANINGVTCGAFMSAYIFDHPCSVTTYENGSMVTQTTYTYNAAGHWSAP